MYNGIGLQTPRGSGTNGYIQANKFHVRARPPKVEPKVFQPGEGRGGISTKANKEILEHDRKRKIALAIVLLEETLIEQGFTDAEIQVRVAEERKKLEEAADKEHNEKVRKTESHQIAALKEKEIERFRNALGAKDRKEGEAFDRDVQALEKEDRRQQFFVRQDEKDKRKKEQEAEKHEREKEERRKRRDNDREESSRKGKRDREEEVPRKEQSGVQEKRRYRDEEHRRREYGDKRSEERRRDEEDGMRHKRKREEERKWHLDGRDRKEGDGGRREEREEGRSRKEEDRDGGLEEIRKEERDERRGRGKDVKDDGGRKKPKMADQDGPSSRKAADEKPESEPEQDRWVPQSDDSESSEDDDRVRRSRWAGR